MLAVGVCEELFGGLFVGNSQRYQDAPRAGGKHAQPGVEQKQYAQVNRHPGGIKKGKQAVAGQKLAQAG